MDKVQFLKIRNDWNELEDNVLKVGQFFYKEFNDYIRMDPEEDYLRVVFYHGIDEDHGCSLDLKIPYHLLVIDETWENRMIVFRMHTKWEIKH